MFEELHPLALGLVAVFNPDEGHGPVESIIAIMVVVGVFSLIFFQIEVPTWMVGTFTFISGAWLGGQARDNTKRSKK